MVKLKVPEDGTGCSHGGKEYEADKNGVVEVPEEAVADLLGHGFTIAPAVKKEGK